MKTYCEIVVFELLPAIRAEISRGLIEKHGLKQTEVSEELGITQPAVSQYRHGHRGGRSDLLSRDKRIGQIIMEMCNLIASKKVEPREIHERFCEICKMIRSRKLICENHEKASPNITPCNLCSGQD